MRPLSWSWQAGVVGGSARGGGTEEVPKSDGLSRPLYFMFLQAAACFSDSCVALLGPSTALKTRCQSRRPGFVPVPAAAEAALSE